MVETLKINLNIHNGQMFRLYDKHGEQLAYFICPAQWDTKGVNKLISGGMALTAVKANTS